MAEELLVAASVAATITFAIEPFVIRRLTRASVLDIPNTRSSHSRPVPRGGGIALVIGLGIGAIVASRDVWPGVVVISAFALLGLADDVTPIPAARRLAIQVGLALASGFAAWALADSAEIAVAVLACALLIPAAVNAVNFMDGINGITGLNALVSGALLAAAAWDVGAIPVAIIAVAIAGAAVGFLPWNLGRGRVFLGDVGSYAIGAGLGLCAVAVWLSGAGVLAAIGPLLLYFADTGSTIVRRASRRERLLEAHHSHVYQRLTDLGLGHTSVALFTASMSAVIGILCLRSSRSEGRPALQIVVGGLLIAVYLASPELLERWRQR